MSKRQFNSSDVKTLLDFKPNLIAQGVAFAALATAGSVTFATETQDQVQSGVVEEIIVQGERDDRLNSHKYTQPLLDTAKTINRITEEQMLLQGISRVQDAVRNVPGITLAAGEGGSPPGDNLVIRGFSARTDIFIDNVRDIAGYTRGTYNLESIEVAKGPGSSVTGRGSTGGSLNLQTKTAHSENTSRITAGSSTEGGWHASVDSNVRLGDNTALRINAISQDSDVAGRDEIYNSSNAVAGSLVFGLDAGTRWILNGEYQKQDNLPDYGLPWVPNYSGRADRTVAANLARYQGFAPPVDFENYYGNTRRDYEDIESSTVTARVEHDLAAIGGMLRLQARTSSVERESIVNAPRFLYESVDGVRVYGADSAIGLNGEKTRNTENGISTVQADLVGAMGDSIRHDFVVGIEYLMEDERRYTFDDSGTDNLDVNRLSVDLFNPVADVPFTGQYRRDGSSTVAEGTTVAIYAYDTMTLNEHWELTGGLRWEEYETVYHFDASDHSRVLQATDDMFSYNAAVVYKPQKNGSIYFGVGKSFNPSAEDLTASTRGNIADLDPEESTGFESGAKWSLFNDRLLASTAIFRTEKINARTDNPELDENNFDRLDGEQRVDGFELGLTGQVNDRLQISTAYTYQDSEVTRALGDDAPQQGNPLPRTPRHSFSVWGTYNLSDRFMVGLGGQHLGKRYNSSSPGSREQAPSYEVFEAMASFAPTQNLNLQLNAKNLTDEKYIDSVGGGHFIPGLGRLVTLTVSFDFNK